MRIVALKQIDLPITLPFLDLLLATKRSRCRIVNLELDEPTNPVPLRKAGHQLVFVVQHASRKI
jgi:hypothetical protein